MKESPFLTMSDELKKYIKEKFCEWIDNLPDKVGNWNMDARQNGFYMSVKKQEE